MGGKKGKFTARATSVLGINRPADMRDFLSDEARVETTEGPGASSFAEGLEGVARLSLGHEIVRNAGNTEIQTDGACAPAVIGLEALARSKTEREEFRFTPELANRLRRYCYERRMKKTRVVTQALERFLESEGF